MSEEAYCMKHSSLTLVRVVRPSLPILWLMVWSVLIGYAARFPMKDIPFKKISPRSLKVPLLNACNAPTFLPPINFIVDSDTRSVAVSDFNKDGNPDLVVANIISNSLLIFLGDGTGNFNPPTRIFAGIFPFAVAAGDFDKDGNPDFASANFISSDALIFLGDGLGGFSSGRRFAAGGTPNSIVAGARPSG
jgi:hypothetical protein